MAHYETCLAALSDLSKGARIFCVVHKMDLLQESDREAKFQEKRARIMEVTKPDFKSKLECYRTSIWDETLYKALSTIVSTMLPNI